MIRPFDFGPAGPVRRRTLVAALLALTGCAAVQSEPAAQAGGPSWSTRVNKFDPATGAYNLNARTLGRFREAKARAVAGSGELHISVLGDSTTMQATYTASAYIQAWPGRMRDHLILSLGLTNGGTGLMGTWDLFGGWNFTDSAVFPHLSWDKEADGGDIQRDGVRSSGIFGANGVAIHSGGTSPFTSVQINPVGGQMVDQIWVYLLTSDTDTLVDVTDGTTTHKFQVAAYYGKTVTPQSGYTVVACEPGFVRSATPSTGGIRVAKLTVPAQNNWTARVRAMPYPSVARMTMFEARLSTANFRVSNLAQGGMSLSDIFAANDESAGNGGMPQGVDTPGADLAIIALGLNDWLSHGSVATFKSRLATLVERQKFIGRTGTAGYGTGASGDALLVIQPTPDLTRLPATGGNVPPLADFWHATYQVADEQDVALIDQSWRWTNFTTSARMYRAGDAIHPNEIGHADLGIAIGAALAQI
jgi:GDSL-like Lipase/Acylhydrolase family